MSIIPIITIIPLITLCIFLLIKINKQQTNLNNSILGLDGEFIRLQKKHDILFISKLKLIACDNTEFYNQENKEELKVFLIENDLEDVYNATLILSKDFKEQLRAIIEILEQKHQFKVQ